MSLRASQNLRHNSAEISPGPGGWQADLRSPSNSLRGMRVDNWLAQTVIGGVVALTDIHLARWAYGKAIQ